MGSIIVGVIVLFIFSGGIFLYWKSYSLRKDLEKHESDIKKRMYELAILKELGDRIGYSLNIQKIVDVITGSLTQFIEYSAVSYMLLEPEKIIFKVDLEQSVSRVFVDDIRDRMLKSLSALLNKDLKKGVVEEIMTGAILVDELKDPVRSFFNIPLVIGEKVVGVLTVAHTKEGLYKEDEMTILYKITQQASSAVTKLQEVVKTEQGKLNAMVESMAEGVVMTDIDYRIMVVNPAAKQIIGLPEKDELTIFDFIDNLEGKFDIRGKLEESVKLNKVLTSQEVVIKDRFYQILVSPVISDMGLAKDATLGGVVLFHDITHEKEIERLREDFTSMMVHELRAPLDGIKKISEVMEGEDVRNQKEKYGEYVGMIHENSSSMLTLVSGLLDVAKLESGKFKILKTPQNIREIINERINFFLVSAKNAKINLRSVISEKVPEKLEIDSARIAQVLNNYVSNAFKFTEGGGEVVIQAFLHEKGHDVLEEASEAGIKHFLNGEETQLKNIATSVIIGVTDSGVGISREDQKKIFSKFSQLRQRTVKEGQKGTGLGLVIVKGIIEAHGGMVGVGSEQGEGSTFYCTLPIHFQE